MDPDSYTSNSLVERELRGRLSEAEDANNTLRRLLSRAEEEVEIVRSLSEKFKRLLSEAEAKNLQGKLAYLDLENNYERERMMRMNLEKTMDGHVQSQAFGSPSMSLKRKATTDVIVIEDDPMVTESNSTNNKTTEAVIKPTTPPKSERSGSGGFSKPTVPLSQSSTQSLLSDKAFDDIYMIEDEDEPAPKRRKLERRQDVTSDSNETSGINISSTVSEALPIEMPTSSRTVVQGSIRAATPQPSSRNSSTSVASSDTWSVSEGPSTPSPEPADVLMSNSPTKSNSKLNHSPMSPKIASSSTLLLPVMPIKAEGGWSLRPSQVAKYLGSTQIFPISPPPVVVRVSRAALTEAYNLPGMGFLWVSKSKRNPLRVMMPTYEVNPEMPRAPGEPGILLSCRKEMCKDGPWTLFVKVEGLKTARWDYAGEYISQIVGKMSKEEFQSQDPAVKETWGKKIEKHKKYPVYRELRARITIRKTMGREPTDDEVAKEAARITSKEYTSALTYKDVIKAFERGEEFISVVKTKCIAYHHSRANEYARAQETYEAIEKAEAHFSSAKRKRSRETRKKNRTPATAPAPYEASTIPQNVASTSGTRQESPASSAVSTQEPERVVRQRKKSSKLIGQ